MSRVTRSPNPGWAALCVGLLAIAAPGAASAQVEGRSRGNLGGGFIEMLMTGTTPSHRQGAPIIQRMPQPDRYRAREAIDPAYSRYPGAVYAAPDRGRPVRVAHNLEDDPFAQPVVPGRGPRQEIAPAAIGAEMDPRFEKQDVSYDGRHAPGTIVIDTPNRFLYLVQGNGRALRYGIGVGRPGFEWAGVKSVTQKREWPDWRPPEQMLKRRPDLPRYMAGGPDNPLGARALYLGSSLYRIHGTNEPATIGRAVSSGCIRMRNEDVIDLYGRVRVGSRVIVI